MASDPVTSWQIDGETVTGFIFLGSKISVDGDCSHEIQRCLLLGWKAMTNLDSILKSRVITLLTKVCIVKAMVFPVVMYRCGSQTIKKAEHWRTDIQPVNPKGNQPWIFIERTEAEAPVLWPPGAKSRLMTLMLGKIEGRRSGQQRMRWLNGIIDSLEFEQILRDSEGQRNLASCSQWCCKGHNWATEQQKYLTIWRPVLPVFPWGNECLILALHPELLLGPVKN